MKAAAATALSPVALPQPKQRVKHIHRPVSSEVRLVKTALGSFRQLHVMTYGWDRTGGKKAVAHTERHAHAQHPNPKPVSLLVNSSY